MMSRLATGVRLAAVVAVATSSLACSFVWVSPARLEGGVRKSAGCTDNPGYPIVDTIIVASAAFEPGYALATGHGRSESRDLTLVVALPVMVGAAASAAYGFHMTTECARLEAAERQAGRP
jgi:hypothetical protein